MSIKSRKGKEGFTLSLPNGFTVVELLVAMSIFAIFLSIAFGVFVQAVKGQRELTRFMAVQNNAGLVLEQMMREMRTGYWFCDGTENGAAPCETSGNSLTFKNHEGEMVRYRLDSEKVGRQVVGVDDDPVPLTSSVVRISNLQFLVTQQGNPCVPPRITVAMQAGLAGAGNVAPVNLETSVSSRVFPVDVKGASLSLRSSCYVP
ncbi:MAG: type II secretion system protein [Candidatus Jorgensenbacteria bacterium]